MRTPPKPRPRWRQELPVDAVATVERVALHMSLDPETLFDGTSTGRVRDARSAVMRLLRVAQGYGCQEVADCFLVHHTTVLHAVKKSTGAFFDPTKNTGAAASDSPLSRSNLREYQR